MMIYPKEVIEKAIAWIEGDNYAKEWLSKNNFEELIHLKDATSRNARALEFLIRNKHITLAAFSNAIWSDKKAFQLLMDTKQVHWAAMANYINGDNNAGLFLQKNKLDHYATFAKAIQTKIRKEADKASSIFNSGPFKISDE